MVITIVLPGVSNCQFGKPSQACAQKVSSSARSSDAKNFRSATSPRLIMVEIRSPAWVVKRGDIPGGYCAYKLDDRWIIIDFDIYPLESNKQELKRFSRQR